MNSLFNHDINRQIIDRINHLNSTNRRQWGKMNTGQMLAHCAVALESALGDVNRKRTIAGLLFGRIARKQILSDKPFKRNLPTSKVFVITNEKNLEEEKMLL